MNWRGNLNKRPLIQIVQIGLELWVRSQCKSLNKIKIEIIGSTLEILSSNGYVSGGVLQAGNLIRLPNVGAPGTDEPNEDGEFPEKELPQTILDVGISLKNRKQFNELEKLAQESLHFLQVHSLQLKKIEI